MFFLMIIILIVILMIGTQGGPRVPWSGATTTTPALGPEARLCQVNKVHEPKNSRPGIFKISIK